MLNVCYSVEKTICSKPVLYKLKDHNFVLFPLFHLKLTAAIVFLSFGIITCFLCLVIDGGCIVLNLVSYLR